MPTKSYIKTILLSLYSKCKEGSGVNDDEFADIMADMFSVGQMPVGSIIAWHKSFTGTPVLPVAWAECNGQIISDSESPYNGRALPNLNGEARFLRGSNISGTLQASQNKNHQHGVKLGGSDSGSSYQIATGGNYYDSSKDDTTEQNGTLPSGGDESRPVNMSVVWIMRIK